MAFLSLPTEAESLACVIHKFQRNTGNKKATRIKSTLQKLINCIATTEPIGLPILDVPKKKKRAAASASSGFYDSSWLTDVDMFPKVVAHFEEVIANSCTMNSSLQQLITSVVTSAITRAVTFIQAKHDNKMLSLWEMIKISLLVRKSPSATPLPNHDATPKAYLGNDSLPKTSTERWNQANLGYFDPHLNRAYGEGEIVLVRKDVYYKNVVLFVQHLQNLVTFRDATLVKANIATSF